MLTEIIFGLALATVYGADAVAAAATSTQLSSSSSSSSTKTSTAAGATHTILTGEDGFLFTPSVVSAAVGDVIQFQFYPQNHSVARAAFAQDGRDVACIPYEYSGLNRGQAGFWSGWEPVDTPPSSSLPVFNLIINDTEPVFFYCSAPGACYNGMIGVINPNSTFTLDIQEASAFNSSREFSPLENFPEEIAPTRTTSMPADATTTSTSTAIPSSMPSSMPMDMSLSGGAIAGIVIGSIAGIVLFGTLIYFCARHRSLTQMLRNKHAAPDTSHHSYLDGSGAAMAEAKYAGVGKDGGVVGGRFSPYEPSYTEGETRVGSPSPEYSARPEQFGTLGLHELDLGEGHVHRPQPQQYVPPPVQEFHELPAEHPTGLGSHPRGLGLHTEIVGGKERQEFVGDESSRQQSTCAGPTGIRPPREDGDEGDLRRPFSFNFSSPRKE